MTPANAAIERFKWERGLSFAWHGIKLPGYALEMSVDAKAYEYMAKRKSINREKQLWLITISMEG